MLAIPIVKPLVKPLVTSLVRGGSGLTGLLDTYGGAAAAYSLRALRRSWVAGDVILARRSSDNAELGFTAAEITNGTLAAWAGVGDAFVKTWYDQSGNAKNLTQSTAGSQPQIVASGSLLADGVKFDGIDDGFPFNSIGLSINALSSFLVTKHTAPGDNQCAFAASIFTDSRRYYLPFTSASNFYFGYGNSTTAVNLGADNTSLNLFTAIAGSSTASAYKNGTVGTPATVASATGISASGASVGNIAGSNEWNGSIKELVVYSADHSANRSGIESNISDYYEITLA